MNTKELIYNKFSDFLTDILPTGDLGKELEDHIFRGESTSLYKLIPSAFRKGVIEHVSYDWIGYECAYSQLNSEYIALNDFYKRADYNGLKLPVCKPMKENYFDSIGTIPKVFLVDNSPIYKEIEDIAALAQHYGVPTRMLDWSFDIFVAMYFACSSALESMSEKLEKIVPSDLDDYIVVWALNAKEFEHSRRFAPDRYPLNFIVPNYYSNLNLQMQKGVLTYWDLTPTIIDKVLYPDTTHYEFPPTNIRPYDEIINDLDAKEDTILLYKIKIPILEAMYMYSFISKIGYTSAKLFPGYKGVVMSLEMDKLYRKCVYGLANESELKASLEKFIVG